ITGETALVTVMHANNEVGSIQPLARIAAIARARGIPVHTDAAQSFGKIPVDVDDLGVDLLSIAGQKIYGPKGVGALYVREGTALERLIHGAGQEAGRRAGTESILLVAGLGKACELAAARLEERARHGAALRDRLWAGLAAAVPGLIRHGDPARGLPNTLSVSFPGREAAALLGSVPEIAASAGAACHSGEVNVSDTLAAMGVSREGALGTIRFSTGAGLTAEEVDQAVEILAQR
ncbi:MAG: aminotransferase class V-fold PLP-dependent enzyme, partial [Planctomycetota bacterium]